ncbi:hypothetical protein AFLA70_911g000091 [Aspergillus flavus AF70]|nr:hypothetical protein AFLA70_911g000091 [Aspergillus flavus AF70]
MRVPFDILRIILWEMVDILPVQELLRARLVNPIFASEIPLLILKSPRLADSNLIYYHWSRFPYKHRFLRQRIHQHHQYPCVFSKFVHEIFQLPSISLLTEQEKDVLITKLIDAITWSCHTPWSLFSPRGLKSLIEGYGDEWSLLRDMERESLEKTLHVALITSAIIRNDVAELNRVLDQNNTPAMPAVPNFVLQGSTRFGISLVDITARIGSRDLISALAARDPPMMSSSWVYLSYRNRRPWIIAARCANRAFFEAWLEYAKNQRAYNFQVPLNTALRGAIRARNMDMMEYLESICEAPVAFPAMLRDAIGTGDAEIVRWCLRQKDCHVHGSGPYKGPLWVTLHDCPRATRLAILKMLLEHGFDPNDIDPGNRENPLQYAIRTQDVESVRLLVQYGADVNVDSSTSAWTEKQRSPLALAVFKSFDIMQLLLQNGVIRRWSWRGKEHVLKIDTKAVHHMEGVFKELGFDELGVQEKYVGHYIIVNG